MPDLFPGFDEFMAQRESAAEGGYEKRMLKMAIRRVCAAKNQDFRGTMASMCAAAGTDFGFAWFLSNVDCVVPLNICTARLPGLKFHHFLSKNFTRGPLWKVYFEFFSNYSDNDLLAMVFPMTYGGNWVMHNGPESLTPTGENYVTRDGATDDHQLFIQRFDSFIDQLTGMICLRE